MLFEYTKLFLVISIPPFHFVSVHFSNLFPIFCLFLSRRAPAASGSCATDALPALLSGAQR
jgi:hypothetical protein